MQTIIPFRKGPGFIWVNKTGPCLPDFAFLLNSVFQFLHLYIIIPTALSNLATLTELKNTWMQDNQKHIINCKGR